MDFSKKSCTPCKEGTPPLTGETLTNHLKQLGNGWHLQEDHHLEKEFLFKNFKQALAFTNRVGEIAEREGHHPTITLTWGKVTIQIWTHKINALSENDFILASKCDEQYIT